MGLAENALFDESAARREQIADLEHLIDYLVDHPEAYLAFLETQEAAYSEALHSRPNAGKQEAADEQGPPVTRGRP